MSGQSPAGISRNHTGIMLRIVILIVCLSMWACATRPDVSEHESARIPQFNNHPKIQIKKGFSGIVKLSEMLCYCISDSCNPKDRAAATSKAISNLYLQVSKNNLKSDGPLGQILIYKDSVMERFECVKPISHLPQKNLEQGQFVFLESGIFYIYHHFGSYETLDAAYKTISMDLQRKRLSVCGPLREFYITSLEQTSDESRWVTRIMIPVKNQ
jgi:effector-binding domain-containing protein